MADKRTGFGTVLAGRFRLEDLLQETAGAKLWRATDQTLARSVAVHVIQADDPRADAMLHAARTSATVTDGHFLRVLDAAMEDDVAYVVNEWGSGISLDQMLGDGPLPPRRAAWLVKEVADAITTAHRHGIAHGRLVPENVMVTEAGSVKLIGFVVDGVLTGRQPLEQGGEPLNEHESDVLNLAALLYATLVGRWPGSPGTNLPDAPREHGRPLRPRQVRAGIPRPLDAICDRVLNADASQENLPIQTAFEISAALSDFIGDPTSVAQVGYEPTTILQRDELLRGLEADEPGDVETTADHTAARSPTNERPSDAPPSSATAPSADPDATQAGAPLFFDDDTGVGWVSPGPSRGLRSDEDDQRRTAPPPPPPLSEPTPKPLFAPDPPEGRSVRRQPDDARPVESMTGRHQSHHSRHGHQGDGGRHSSHGSAFGSGSLPPAWGPDADVNAPSDRPERWEERDAGKNWLKLAAMVAACVLLVVAIVFAFNLGRGSGGQGSAGESPSAGTSGGAPARPLSITGVSDFDPEGDPPEENPQLAQLAVDGDPTTAWQTMTYFNNPQLGLLKDGVGLVVDLGRPVEVSRVGLTMIGRPTTLEVLAADRGAGHPTSVDGLTQVASARNAGPRIDLELQRPVTTRYLVVWLTSLPPSDDGYQGQVAEIVVRP